MPRNFKMKEELFTTSVNFSTQNSPISINKIQKNGSYCFKAQT